MKLGTLVIIGAAVGAAAGHAIGAPFPGMGENPYLDLIAHHDPSLHTAIRIWNYAAPTVRVSMPRRPLRLGEASGGLRGATLDGLPARIACTVATPREGWDGMHIPSSQMPHRASEKGGRYGHGLRLQCGTSAPATVVQPQAGQRHPQCADLHVRNMFERTSTPISHVRLRIGIGRAENRLHVIVSGPKIAKLRHSRLAACLRSDFRASEHLLLAEAPSLHDTSCVQIVQSINRRGIE